MATPSTLIVIGGLSPQELVPDPIREMLGAPARASRLHETYCVTSTDRDSDEARALLASSSWPCAVGPAEVWSRFPDLRGEFSLRVERVGFAGSTIADVRLNETVVGDKPVDAALTFVPWVLARDQNAPPLPSISVDPGELADVAPALKARAVVSGRDLSGCGIYILDQFSLQDVGLVVPGVEFLSARDLMSGSNFAALFNDNVSKGFGSQSYWMPERFTGAFITRPSPSHQTQYWDAIISRILAAAAAATSAIDGSVAVQLYVSPGEFRYHPRVYESWSMPFRPWPVRRRWTVARDDQAFWRAMEILASSDEARFEAAKEDYRALSLETAADSRHSLAPAVQYTQIWMALERLLPFRHETTMQLAIALPALVAATERHEEFERLKKLYDLRSRIAHGYAFKRNQEIFTEIKRVSEIYRRLFKLSLAFDKSEALQQALLAHVLTGQVRAIDDKGAL